MRSGFAKATAGAASPPCKDAEEKEEEDYYNSTMVPGDEETPLTRAATENVVDWGSYYALRGLPLESPAALLMCFPLTLFHLVRRFGGVGLLQQVADESHAAGTFSFAYLHE
eukprot:COSAG05_NODE_296_length_11959_cov_17.897639_2_plen_112_part_00